jgi:diacylglycerol kinase family enzyme
LGIPLNLDEACRVIAAQNMGRVDVGEVNGHVFVNNSSLGIYPRMVLDREATRRRHRLGKWTAMVLAVFKVFRRFPMVRVRLAVGAKTVARKTPVVFVGNNRYQLDLFKIGRRSRLDGGELSLYIAKAHSRWAMLKLTLRALFGRLAQARDFEFFCLSSCRIESRRRRLHVAADGEVLKLSPPLLYRVRPGDLRVCLPADRPSQTA